MHFPTGGREVLQRREIWECVLSERSGGLGDVFAEVPAGAVLGRVDGDDVVADGFVQDPDEWGNGVLDGRGGVLGLPGVDGAVDHSGGDLRDSDVPERWQNAKAEPGVVQLGGGGGVEAALPPLADRGRVVSQRHGGVVAGFGCPRICSKNSSTSSAVLTWLTRPTRL
ncbi:hypothetical protein [Rathayibacter rathayi]|uniref:hypothetical protein n=1 Tax=Rathayibacter rathayi TaxID=33887 RepID=UPI00215732A3|nr:hypothetical protein [Rathayibacter rathayi]